VGAKISIKNRDNKKNLSFLGDTNKGGGRVEKIKRQDKERLYSRPVFREEKKKGERKGSGKRAGRKRGRKKVR